MKQDRLIWFAIVFSTVIYAVIVYTMFPKPEGSFEDGIRQQFTLILYGLALATFVIALVLPSMMRSPVSRLKMIVSLALFEACVIYGLMAAFLAHDWRLFVPTWIVGLLGMWRVYPSNADAAASSVTRA